MLGVNSNSMNTSVNLPSGMTSPPGIAMNAQFMMNPLQSLSQDKMQPQQPLNMNAIYSLVLELTNPEKRETALLELRYND